MRRFFIEEIREKNGLCTISGPEARHITKVLRMGHGDRLIIMDGKGERYHAVIESVGRQELQVLLEHSLPKPPVSPVEITLCQALLRSRSMDYVIQKTSELGVNRIIPFTSQRTVTRLERDRAAKRWRHWSEIARNVAKQSDRITPAEIDNVSSLRDMTDDLKGQNALKVIMWEGEESKDLKGLLRESSAVNRFVGIVGPEGGFSEEEIKAAVEAGLISVSLGYRILRAETAAITMVALVQYEWGDLSLNPVNGLPLR